MDDRPAPPRIVGVHHLSVSVADRHVSAEWYRRVLGFEVHSEVSAETFQRLRMRHPHSGFTLTLTEHDTHLEGGFDERRSGLDHIAWELSDTAAVQAQADRLAALEVEHSPVRFHDDPSRRSAILALRDPDGIQLELIAVETSP